MHSKHAVNSLGVDNTDLFSRREGESKSVTMVELTGEGGRHSLHGSNEVINESYKDSEINLRTSLDSRPPTPSPAASGALVSRTVIPLESGGNLVCPELGLAFMGHAALPSSGH